MSTSSSSSSSSVVDPEKIVVDFRTEIKLDGSDWKITGYKKVPTEAAAKDADSYTGIDGISKSNESGRIEVIKTVAGEISKLISGTTPGPPSESDIYTDTRRDDIEGSDIDGGGRKTLRKQRRQRRRSNRRQRRQSSKR